MTLNRLKALDVKRNQTPGRYADGGGLYLQITHVRSRAIAKSWIFRYRFAGHLSKKGRPLSREMGLGSFPDVSLEKAREKATKTREQISDGVDPLDAKRQAKQQAIIERTKAKTFKECAEAYVASHRAGWRNPKHRQQWSNTLKTYTYPVFGELHVKEIDTALVMKVLQPLWTIIPETANRLRGRIERILDYAKVQGMREGENPARWKGHLDHLLPPRRKVRKVAHHAALPYSELPAFMTELRKREAIAAKALEFLILTASRTEEVIGAPWTEFDPLMWTVPAERMKAGREHRVPLSAAARAVLDDMELVRDGLDGYVFPGDRRPRLSNMAMDMLLRRMGCDMTVHGFRSTFRDWCAEQTHFPREVAEAALAHINADRTEAAYLRADMFEKRRLLMESWAKFCAKPPATDNVRPMSRAAAAS